MMKTFTCVIALCSALLLPSAAFGAAPSCPDTGAPPRDVAPPHANGGPRRPTERWMEGIRERDPDAYRRLSRLREEAPEAFGAELRRRIQVRAVETLLSRHPALNRYLQSLPPLERDLLLESFRQLAAGRIGRPSEAAEEPGVRGARRRGPEREPSAPARPRAEIKAELAAYDRQTERYAAEVERVRRQLQQLEQMLETRRTRREHAVNEQMRRRRHPPSDE